MDLSRKRLNNNFRTSTPNINNYFSYMSEICSNTKVQFRQTSADMGEGVA